jgi:DNA-binding CsgD family transcriptional regulator
MSLRIRQHYKIERKEKGQEDTLTSSDERSQGTSEAVDKVMTELDRISGGAEATLKLYCRVMWHCLLDDAKRSEQQIAAILHISEGEVIAYRTRIEQILQGITFESVEDAIPFERQFEEKVLSLLT